MTTLSAMPAVTDLNSFAQASIKGIWALQSAAAGYELETGEKFPLHVPAYAWNIDQAIINRKGGTMLAAAVEYVESLIEGVVA